MLYYAGGGDETVNDNLLGDFFKKPLGSIDALKNSFTEASKMIQKLDVEMAKVVKTMGVSTAQGLALKENFNQSYQEVVDLGGKLSDVVDQQNALFKTTGKNLISLKEQSAELFAAVSVTGLKAEELQSAFYDVGMETAHIAENVLTMVRISNQLGVNAQAVSKTVTENLDKLNRFSFSNGVEGLAKMAGKAQALRFDVSETFELAEELMSPEKAIEIGAAIQRLGGASSALTDPLRLMDLAQNNLPELQNELGKLAKQYTYFDEKSQSFQIMPGARKQLKEVAEELGIDRKEFEKLALSSASLGKKLSEIQFNPNLDISDEDKEQLANLAQLKDIGGGKKEYVVNYRDEKGETQTARLADLSTKQLAAIQKQTEADAAAEGEDPQKQLVNIAKDQLGAIGKLAAANEKIANTIPMTIASSKTGKESLDYAANFTKTIADAAGGVFGPKSDFKRGVDEFGEKLDNFTNGGFEKLLSGNLTDIKDVITTGGGALFASTKKFIEVLIDGITSGGLSNDDLKKLPLKDGFFTPKGESIKINDGFKTPKPVGDLISTPDGVIEPYPKDYMLLATELPKVLQLSSESGMKKVLDANMDSLSSVISGVLSNTNTNQTNDTVAKQEVVHTINFKVSVDGQNNKLSDVLATEIKNGRGAELMRTVIDNFTKTKTSGGMNSLKK